MAIVVTTLGGASSNLSGLSIPSGAALIVCVAINPFGDDPAPGATYNDGTDGFAFTLDVTVSDATRHRAGILSIFNVSESTGSGSISVSPSTAFVAYQVTGLETAGTDKTAGATGRSTAPSSGSTATTTQDDELVVGGLSFNYTDGTWDGTVTDNVQTYNNGGHIAQAATKIISSTQTCVASQTGATKDYFAACVATFKAGAATPDLEKTASDTLSFSENQAYLFAYLMSKADTLNLTEDQVLCLSHLLAKSDSFTLSDDIEAFLGIRAAAEDTLAQLDTIKLKYDYLTSLSDSFTLSDALETFAQYFAQLADSIYGNFDPDDFDAADFDTITSGLRDNITINLAYLKALADAIELTDELDTRLSVALEIADTLVISDAQTYLLGYLSGLSDTLNLNDTTALIYSYLSSISDTLTISDTAAFQIGILKSIADSLDITDEVDQQTGHLLTSADNLTLTDVATFLYTYLSSYEDALTLSDAAGAELSVPGGEVVDLEKTLEDLLTLSSAINLILQYLLTLDDTLTLTEDLALQMSYLISQSDTLSQSDVINLLQSYEQIASDTLTLSDAQSYLYGSFVNFNDNLNSWNDTLSLYFYQVLGVADSFTIQEYLAIGQGYSVTSSLTLLDALSYNLQIVNPAGVNIYTVNEDCPSILVSCGVKVFTESAENCQS